MAKLLKSKPPFLLEKNNPKFKLQSGLCGEENKSITFVYKNSKSFPKGTLTRYEDGTLCVECFDVNRTTVYPISLKQAIFMLENAIIKMHNNVR